MKTTHESKNTLLKTSTLLIVLTSATYAQPSAGGSAASDDTMLYLFLALAVVSIIAAVLFFRNRKLQSVTAAPTPSFRGKQTGKKENWDAEPVDAEKEMEWYRKNQKVIGKKEIKQMPKNFPKTGGVLNKKANAESADASLPPSPEPLLLSREKLQEKISQSQFSQLPVSSFKELKPVKTFDLLPLSTNADLMSAVEQVQDEFEEDEDVRDLALRILAAFKTRNSVESLAQLALYDVSSNLRSKAVSILADFDHESIFETILLACADPTREVRAAAARGLFRLSFDRADAWTRIIETRDEFRLRQAARAAKEADLVKRSFERLVHNDLKMAYEAFALTFLMIKAGEFSEVFDAIANHNDVGVKLSLLHVLSVTGEESTLGELHNLLENADVTPEVKEKISEAIHSFEPVAA